MKNSLSPFKLLSLVLVLSGLAFSSCRNDDDLPIPLPKEVKIYDLESVVDPDIEGTVTFLKLDDRTTSITIQLVGTPEGGRHPAHIHANTVVEGGPIVVSLEPVNGSTGRSVTLVQTTDDGTPITYEELLRYDGHVNVHLSAEQLDVYVAQGDIGQNELTGKSKEYELEEAEVPNISGVVVFEERRNGEALATIRLRNTPAGGEHPAHIHRNSVEEGGDIVYTFNPVNGTTGISKSNVAALDDGTPFGYKDVLKYDGHVNVHLSAEQLDVYVAQGDIGVNED